MKIFNLLRLNSVNDFYCYLLWTKLIFKYNNANSLWNYEINSWYMSYL